MLYGLGAVLIFLYPDIPMLDRSRRPGQLGELIGVNELNYGYRQDGDYQVIVSSGIGGWGYPIRTGGHSEYVVITLNTKK